VDALALALDGTRTVAAYSLSGEMTSLISISYLALGMGWAGLDQGKHSEKHRSNTLHAWRIGLALRGVFGADFLTLTANQPITSSASLSPLA
jgi:tetrahydromethanopterin S-methyltransferase subunit C